jgi:Fe2+ transport system protein FeoA
MQSQSAALPPPKRGGDITPKGSSETLDAAQHTGQSYTSTTVWPAIFKKREKARIDMMFTDGIVLLENLRPGELGEVHAIVGPPGACRRLAEFGLRPGVRIEMLRPGPSCIIRLNHGKLCLRGHQVQLYVRPERTLRTSPAETDSRSGMDRAPSSGATAQAEGGSHSAIGVSPIEPPQVEAPEGAANLPAPGGLRRRNRARGWWRWWFPAGFQRCPSSDGD